MLNRAYIFVKQGHRAGFAPAEMADLERRIRRFARIRQLSILPKLRRPDGQADYKGHPRRPRRHPGALRRNPGNTPQCLYKHQGATEGGQLGRPTGRRVHSDCFLNR